MRVSREKALENREQIIETAARLLRKHGFDGIGVADIMKAAGLTHGGFYRNFSSKDDLAVKASERAVAETTALLKDELAQQPKDPFRELIERYVSSAHRDDPGFRMHSAGIGRGRRAERRPRSPRCLHHGDSRLSRTDWETVVRDPEGHRQQTSRGYSLGDGWRCHIVSGDCGYPAGGIADCCCGGGYCRTIPGNEIGRGVMQRGSRTALTPLAERSHL